MSAELKRAFVLHRRPFQNSSLLLEIFAEDEGRLPLVARGGAKSKTTGLLQPFLPLRVGWSGKGEVKTLTGYEADDFHLDALAGKKLFCGLYLNELIMRLLPRYEAHNALFAAYIRTLVELAENHDPEWPLRRFELRLLGESGYDVDLTTTFDQQPIKPEHNYSYQQGNGFVQAGADNSRAVSGSTLIALQKKSCEDALNRCQAKQLLRSIIDYHLDYKPLKSRELFR